MSNIAMSVSRDFIPTLLVRADTLTRCPGALNRSRVPAGVNLCLGGVGVRGQLYVWLEPALALRGDPPACGGSKKIFHGFVGPRSAQTSSGGDAERFHPSHRSTQQCKVSSS